ncbi:MAG TPA: cysteine--tRNA ligase [Candidatus Paceibacterota bacterium]
MLSFFRSPSPAKLPALQFHNTLSGKLDVFEPIDTKKNGTVKMYNCGPTVYDYAQIGNLRSYIFADTIRRTLDAWGYKVEQVINITDFGHLVSDGDEGEDKMTKGLKREGLALTLENMRVLAERYTKAFLENLEQIGVDTKRITFPRASDYIPEQIALIKTLEQKGYAYRTPDGVYYDTSRFAGYGKLGHINLLGQQEGARLETHKEKRNPADFVLWKSDTKLGWESPWGLGFPGWHIECTAMIFTLLGKQIDIHTGGIDHIAIHHNNEIAQAEAVTGKQFVRYWMHNEFITIEHKRIGKSQGNAILLRGITDKGLSPRALRYLYLTAHYRSPMNFTWDAVEGANTTLKRLSRAYLEMPSSGAPDENFLKEFYAALANDLDTPKALALVWEHIKTLNRATLVEADNILGLGLAETRPLQKLAVLEEHDLPEEVQKLVADREEARTNKDFARSDELRKQIDTLGFEIKDTPEGQKISSKN